ncbi:MAG: hypothetical protein H6704_27625 [Myxococcales bacterium]|nr:hypothetical protein [Myxococcales bacterium]
MDLDALDLATRFPAPDLGAWRAAAEKVLGGRPAERLDRRTLEGLVVPPAARRLDAGAGRAGRRAFRAGRPRGARGAGPAGTCACCARRATRARAAEAIAADLARGARSVWLRGPWADLDALDAALAPVDPTTTPLLLDGGADGAACLAALGALAERRGVALEGLLAEVPLDPLGTLAREGRLAGGLDAAWDTAAAGARFAERHAPEVRTLCLDGSVYDEGGAHAAQTLGFVLAAAAETLRALDARGLTPAQVGARLTVRLGVGTEPFLAIATLRAARWTLSRLLSAAGADAEPPPIHAVTLARDLGARDPWPNLLRATAACFAAAVGGADAVTLLPFDHAIGAPDALARRLATNLQAVLEHESHLARVTDPAGGAHHVEALTRALAEQAWSRMQTIEADGGLSTWLIDGRAARAVSATAATRQQRLATRAHTMVGVNDFVLADEPPLERGARSCAVEGEPAPARLEGEPIASALAALLDGASLRAVGAALAGQGAPTVAERIVPFRSGVAWEARRDAAAGHTVTLLTLGAEPAWKARAEWTRRVLEAWGLGVHETSDPAQVKGGAVVVCAADADHAALGVPAARALRDRAFVLVAGRAGDLADAWREAGVADFVYLGADLDALGARVVEAIR